MRVRHQRGVALLVALLVVALATLLIAALVDGGALARARTRNQLRAEQARALEQGLESYAALVLVEDQDQGRGIDTNGDVWATPMPPTPVPGGMIHASMRDLDGCMNLNNLVKPDGEQADEIWVGRFHRLLAALQLSPAIADAAVDWIDRNHEIRERGAEDGHYLAQRPAYLAADRPFVDVSELKLVAGVDAHAWSVLQPYVCALPTRTVLNINTASVPVLMSLADGITRPLAERIHRDGQARWSDAETALAALRKAGVTITPAQAHELGVKSEYFSMRAVIELDDIPFVYTSLIQRNDGIRVLQRDQGGA